MKNPKTLQEKLGKAAQDNRAKQLDPNQWGRAADNLLPTEQSNLIALKFHEAD